LKRVVERAAVTAVFGLDLSGRIRWCGDRVELVYGADASEHIGRHASTLWATSPGEARSALDRATISGKWEGGALHRRSGAEPFSVFVTVLLRRNENGKPRDLVVFCRDLSPLQRIDAELCASRAASAPLVDSSAALLLLADFSGTVQRASRRAQDFMARGPSLSGAALTDLFVERYAAEAMMSETRRTEGLEDVELSFLHANGEGLRVRCDTVAVRGRNRDEGGVLVAMRPMARLDAARPSTRRGTIATSPARTEAGSERPSERRARVHGATDAADDELCA
jgi:hypothetical protein